MTAPHPAAPARPRRRARVALLTLLVSGLLGSGMSTVATAPADAARSGVSQPFTVATFNLLGASHTKTRRRGFDTYGPRMRRTVNLINRKGFDFVGFQEYQKPQHQLFVKLTAGSWGVYPGLEAGRRPVQNSIVWREDEWKLMEKRLYTIPYFGGNLVKQPYIRLRNRAEGFDVWVINTHNPADSRGPAQQYRNRAMAIQVDLANELAGTGTPVFLVGDFNETSEAFCTITGGADLKAANGGTWYGDQCRPPRGMRVDWVFLSPRAPVLGFTDLYTDLTRKITDHHVIFSEVQVPLG